MSEKWSPLLALLLLGACSRALDLPQPPGPPAPGSISGKAVISLPGRPQRVPAAGATVSLLGLGRTVTADARGDFLIDGITRASGQLLFRHDSDGDGSFDRQKLLALEALEAGPGKQLAIGEVLLVENGRLHGRALRSDSAAHAGTLAFVPEGPFTATVSGNGSYAFDEMPVGVIGLAFFRTGYRPEGFSALELASGQDLELRDVILEPLAAGQVDPSHLTGRVVMVPSGDPSLTVARLIAADNGLRSSSVADDGTFSFTDLPGLYTLTLTQPGYVTARVPNVLLQPGENPLGDLPLVAGDGGAGGGSGGGPGGGPGGGSGGSGGGAGGAGADAGVPPVAVVLAGTAVRLGALTGRLDASKSYDPLDGGPLLFHWVEETDAGVVLSANDSLVAATPSFPVAMAVTAYRFTLTVTAQGGRTSSPVQTQLEVVAPPSVKVVPSPLTMNAGTTATLSAAMSTDPAGAPLTYAWSVVSGAVTLSGPAGVTVDVTAAADAGMTNATVQLIVSNPAVSADPVPVSIRIN